MLKTFRGFSHESVFLHDTNSHFWKISLELCGKRYILVKVLSLEVFSSRCWYSVVAGPKDIPQKPPSPIGAWVFNKCWIYDHKCVRYMSIVVNKCSTNVGVFECPILVHGYVTQTKMSFLKGVLTFHNINEIFSFLFLKREREMSIILLYYSLYVYMFRHDQVRVQSLNSNVFFLYAGRCISRGAVGWLHYQTSSRCSLGSTQWWRCKEKLIASVFQNYHLTPVFFLSFFKCNKCAVEIWTFDLKKGVDALSAELCSCWIWFIIHKCQSSGSYVIYC